MMKILKFLTLPTLLAAVSCGSNSPAKAPSVHVDTRFTTLYSPDSNGVTGSDGAISIVLDDGSSLFMTGDCFLGEVVGGKRDFSYGDDQQLAHPHQRRQQIPGSLLRRHARGAPIALHAPRSRNFAVHLLVLARPRIPARQYAPSLHDEVLPGRRGAVGLPLRRHGRREDRP